MKIFNDGSGWDSKVNFVDVNNVLVGYDMDQHCCENADYFISKTEDNEPKKDNGISEGLEEYCFDKDYFVEVEPKMDGSENYRYSCLNEGGMVRFRLKAEGKPDLYLHLFNSHNGYYGHGFEAKIGGIDWKSGSL